MTKNYLLLFLILIPGLTIGLYGGTGTGNFGYTRDYMVREVVNPIFETRSDTCEIPTDLQVSDITAQSATVNWLAPQNPPGSGYAFEVRQSGSPGSGPAGLFTSGYTAAGVTTLQVNGLAFNTQYYAYVRSNCGDNVYSEWTAGVPFLALDPLELSAEVLHQSCFMSCDGAISLTVSGGLTPYAYQWSNGAVTPDVDGLCTDIYEVTVTDATLATVTGNWTIMAPGEISMIADANDISCYGANDGSISIESVEGGTPPYSFMWSNGATTTSLTGLSSGFYRVTVMDANECDIRTGTFIAEPDPMDGFTTPTPASCPWQADGSIDLAVYGGTPPYTFLWSHGSTQEDPSDLLPGNYGVTITDYQLCELSLSAVVPTIQPICENAAISGGASETVCYDALQHITVAGNGNTFIVTGSGSATFIAGISIVFREGTMVSQGGHLHGYISPEGPFCNADRFESYFTSGESAREPEAKRNFLLWPNPAREDVTIAPYDGIWDMTMRYEVYNAMGKFLFSGNLPSSDNRAGISGLTAGLYLIRMHSVGRWETHRVIKTH